MSDECLDTHYHDRAAPVPIRSEAYYYLDFDGNSSFVGCGSDATLDNLPSGAAVTIDLWAQAAVMTVNNDWQTVCSKFGADGWYFGLYRTGDVTYIDGYIGAIATPAQSRVIHTPGDWHHYALAYDDTADRKIYFAVDGVWAAAYALQTAAVGVVADDSANTFLMGDDSFNYFLDGAIQWLRISDAMRWVPGVDFTAPAMCAPPTVDGDTAELWAIDEGTGATTAASVTAANNGALTDCDWYICI